MGQAPHYLNKDLWSPDFYRNGHIFEATCFIWFKLSKERLFNLLKLILQNKFKY